MLHGGLKEVLDEVYLAAQLQNPRADHHEVEHGEELVHTPEVLVTCTGDYRTLELRKRKKENGETCISISNHSFKKTKTTD